jgi:UDP-N-acetylglucosamine diphosphorylase / glucose-1-phosphate thymidylyltransferase / UDP-N-acetylgalactosamine diphosphorylase / glucosamine-1-phosphate N-acetyltransferase / galactosamine-1-phosphate N-acetyltransferase
VNKPFQICIFTDKDATTLTPYQLTRPCYTIPNGYYNLVEKLHHLSPDTPITLLCTKLHAPFLKKRYPKIAINLLNKSLPTLYINGRCTITKPHFSELLNAITSEKNYLFIKENNVIGAFCTDNLNEQLFKLLSQEPNFEDITSLTRKNAIVEEKRYIQMITHWWDYLTQLSHNLLQDFESFPNKSLIEGHLSTFSILTNDNNMFIHRQSTIKEFTSLDASNGPIFIDAGVLIHPFVSIIGPCYIGKNSIINAHTTISNSYVGEHCKIGGEVKNSIIQSYSNKAHDGFLGDSLVGEWVNLGAGTTTSNLKLSYGNIRSSNNASKETMDTKKQFLGTLFGDYVKTGIQSAFECGAIISSACSLYGTAVHPKFVPPFTWGNATEYQNQNMAAFVETLERTMARRNITLSDEEKMRFKTLQDSLTQQHTVEADRFTNTTS